MNRLYVIFVFLFLSCIGFGQTSDVVEGCSPLRVQFNSTSLSQYYWDFADGGFSTNQNPEYIYTEPGIYIVILKEGQNGAEVGQIQITVYREPILNIDFDKTNGCSPLQVNFTSTIDIDEDVDITGYKWSFGDGNTSNQVNPTHIYTTPGLFTVSLEVTSSFRACSKTQIFFDVIEVGGSEGDFSIIAGTECVLPFQYAFTNLTEQKPGNKYFWDFGNGVTSTFYNPGTITYTQEGEFNVSLVVTSAEGCETIIVKQVIIGVNKFNLPIPDTLCIDLDYFLGNNSTGTFFQWQFQGNHHGSASSARNPRVKYKTEGWKTISLRIGNNPQCRKDTTFMVYIENPFADFTFDPLVACENPMEITLSANNKTFKEYYWNQSGENTSPDEILIVTAPPRRDSFHMNFIDTVFLELMIISHAGCRDTIVDTAYHHRPDAYFLSSEPRGCTPLIVNFEETSLTHSPIVYRKWLFGDGTEEETPGSATVSHTYTEPGEYFAKLVIENADGCRDTSVGMWIYVGEPIEPEFELDKTEICIGESISVEFFNNDPRIEDFHLTTDDGRFQHCWTEKTATHVFETEPGFFDVTAHVVYNGCYGEIVYEDHILVKGAKANIGFKTNCDEPLEVDFTSKSIDATRLLWTIEDVEYTEEEFRHAFSSKGDYMVYLEAENIASGCEANLDSQIVYIREIKAVLEGPDTLCTDQPYAWSGANSIDVDRECSKGYLWKYSYKRPRETNLSENFDLFQSNFAKPNNKHWIQLIVENTNGCRDTATMDFVIYDLKPNFDLSDNDICLPADVAFTDLSTSDTTIVGWNWFNGNSNQNMVHTFLEPFTTFNATLEVVDAVGCRKSIFKTIRSYKPTSTISLNPGNTICKGNQVNFNASDYTIKGSNLDFQWDIGGLFTSDIRNPFFVFEETGVYPIELVYTEQSSGCQDTARTTLTVIEQPVADFSSDVDDLPFICHPRIINFMNESESEGIVNYQWTFRNTSFSTVENPSEGFPKGEHEVVFIVRSIFGCADTISRSYVLIGPEGDIELDSSPICTNQEIMLSVIDTVDLTSYQWIFGDGQTFSNQSPVIVKFDLDPSITAIPVRLIMTSGENQCELVVQDSISFFAVSAEFEIRDTVACEGQVFLDNYSIGATNYFWDFGDGTTSTDLDPTHTYETFGEKFIQLIISANEGACTDTITYSTILEEDSYEVKFPNVFTPNGDGQNDIFKLNIDEELNELVEFLEFKIINRWGHVVFNNEDPRGWDGNYNGQPAPAEVYKFILVARIKGCDIVSKNGNVTLIR